jgi:D-alanine-D-alanine ligase-like ATP-grasp enzyme
VAKRLPETRRAVGRRRDFYERVWLDAAREVGAEAVPLGGGIYELRRGGAALRVAGDVSPVDDGVTLRVAGDKALAYRLLEQRGLPVPRHAVYSLDTIRHAREFMRGLGRDCVVKPARNSAGGRGITTGIRRALALGHASSLAAAYDDLLLIEEQVPGDNYRLLFLDGELIDIIVRRSPTITGDGRSTVRALVAAANARRQAADDAEPLLRTDLEMRTTLARQGLRLRSVPEAGRSVTLKTVINQNGADDNASARDLMCESIRRDAAEAGRAVGARLVGVDVITTDPTRPLQETGGVILEVNTTPGFHFHYHPGAGSVPVASEILDRLLTREGSGG